MLYRYVYGAWRPKVIDDMFENQVYLIHTKFLILRLHQRRQWKDKVLAWYIGLSKIDYIMLKVKVLHYRYPPVTLAGFWINLIPLRKITTDRSFCIIFSSFLLHSMLRNHTYDTQVFPLKLPQCWGRDARNMYMCYTGRLMTVVISTWGPGDGGLSQFTLFGGQDQGILFWNFRACI